MTTKKYYATRDFNDAGTEEAFVLGDELTNKKGLSNYLAAGLASDKKPEAPKDDAAPAA